LLEAFPDLNRPADQLMSIPGYPPRLNELPPGCRFEPRCHKKIEQCALVAPKLIDVTALSESVASSWSLAVGKTASTRNQHLATNNHLAACHLRSGPEVTER
jgi:oligopeptide/dipeptide ABC transporter ATP-binding protein